ncbi:MAG: Stealth CR1 domain-containing protein, partial [Alphaproteobacteria bacterium]
MTATEGIDVVITWVDGFEPSYLAKRAQFGAEVGHAPAGADAQARYADAGELVYCLRSIYAYMRWARRIFLVTDNQTPPYLDAAMLAKHDVFVVNHDSIFKEYASLLPVFSSTAIESMIWRIDGLSEYFVLFNDDCFLGKKVIPADFYRDDKLQLRGRWMPDEGSEGLPGWKVRQLRASRLAGVPQGRFYLSDHAPFALRRSMMEETWDRFREDLMGNITRRFRDRDMVNL